MYWTEPSVELLCMYCYPNDIVCIVFPAAVYMCQGCMFSSPTEFTRNPLCQPHTQGAGCSQPHGGCGGMMVCGFVAMAIRCYYRFLQPVERPTARQDTSDCSTTADTQNALQPHPEWRLCCHGNILM